MILNERIMAIILEAGRQAILSCISLHAGPSLHYDCISYHAILAQIFYDTASHAAG